MGLVNRIVSRAHLESAVFAMAKELSSPSGVAVQFTKRAIYRSRDASLAHALELVATMQGVLQVRNTKRDHN